MPARLHRCAGVMIQASFNQRLYDQATTRVLLSCVFSISFSKCQDKEKRCQKLLTSAGIAETGIAGIQASSERRLLDNCSLLKQHARHRTDGSPAGTVEGPLRDIEFRHDVGIGYPFPVCVMQNHVAVPFTGGWLCWAVLSRSERFYSFH